VVRQDRLPGLSSERVVAPFAGWLLGKERCGRCPKSDLADRRLQRENHGSHPTCSGPYRRVRPQRHQGELQSHAHSRRRVLTWRTLEQNRAPRVRLSDSDGNRTRYLATEEATRCAEMSSQSVMRDQFPLLECRRGRAKLEAVHYWGPSVSRKTQNLQLKTAGHRFGGRFRCCGRPAGRVEYLVHFSYHTLCCFLFVMKGFRTSATQPLHHLGVTIRTNVCFARRLVNPAHGGVDTDP
jgi:hypothetical protein